MTSGMRNNSIDLEAAKAKNILVCGTEINSNPAAELTWTLILGLYRNIKQEVDKSWLIYFESSEDIAMVLQNFTPKQPDAPAVHNINIVDEFKL